MEKFVRVAAPVQRYKSVSLRECFNRMIKGLPINAKTHQLHDLPDDVDMDAVLYDEYSDKLEVRQALFDDYELKQQKKGHKDPVNTDKNPLNEKGGIDNETPPDEVPKES